MSNIPTAEEFCKSYETKGKTWQDNFHETMIEFAKLHVKAALEDAGKIANNWENSGELEPEILNAYPETNIK